MATTTVQTTPTPSSTPNYASTNLTRLLSRLEAILLNPAPSNTQLRLLRRSQYERSRVTANVEHARTLLFRVEHAAAAAAASSTQSGSALPIPSLRLSTTPFLTSSTQQQPHNAQVDTAALRTRVRRLQRALDELNHLPLDEREPEPDPATVDEDLVALYAGDDDDAAASTAAASKTGPAAPTPTPGPGVRARKQAANTDGNDADEKGAHALSASSSTFGGRKARDTHADTHSTSSETKQGQGHSNTASDARAASLLEAHDSAQTDLTEQLLALSGQLRASAAAVGAQLADGDPLVERAAAALERNTGGLAKAGGRMGTLRRMTEGKGWIARMGLYGWIAAVWVGLILVVFVGPKLRLR